MRRGGERYLVSVYGFFDVSVTDHEHSAISSADIAIDGGWCCSPCSCRLCLLMFSPFCCVRATYQLLTPCGWCCCRLLLVRFFAFRSMCVLFGAVAIAGVFAFAPLTLLVVWLFPLIGYGYRITSCLLLSPGVLFGRFADFLGYFGRVSTSIDVTRARFVVYQSYICVAFVVFIACFWLRFFDFCLCSSPVRGCLFDLLYSTAMW